MSNYILQPGRGALFVGMIANSGVSLWTGQMKLNDGTLTYLEAKALPTPRPHFECKMKRMDTEGKNWDLLAEFKMRSFSGKVNAVQDVNIKGIGKAKAWVRNMPTDKDRGEEPGDNGQFIAFQLIDAPKPKIRVP